MRGDDPFSLPTKGHSLSEPRMRGDDPSFKLFHINLSL